MYLGAHESIGGGVFNAFDPYIEDGAECLQIFSKNANQWQARPLSVEDREKFIARRSDASCRMVAVHDSYLINLAQPNNAKWERALTAFRDEMERADFLGCDHLIFHPGAHIGSGEERGIARITEALTKALMDWSSRTMILIETTAGTGTNLGYNFEQIGEMIDLAGKNASLGVCYDTCHTFTAGYDIRTEDVYGETFDSFDSAIGLRRLHAFHLNDSMKPFGSRKDRHEQIGKGEIGMEAFRMLVNDKRFETIPGYLETPPLSDGERSYRLNLDLLKSMRVVEE